MRDRKKRAKIKSLTVAKVFAIIVSFLLAISLAFRVATIIAQSSFDGTHRFTVAIAADNDRSIAVISFSPQKRAISHLSVSADTSLAAAKIGKALKIPIDGVVTDAPTISLDGDEKRLMFGLLTSYGSLKTKLTILDLLRLFLFAQSVPRANVVDRQLLLPSDDAAVDALAEPLFADEAIVEEKATIAIVNGTEVAGLGALAARLVANMGGNVVSVTSKKEQVTVSQIINHKEQSYTYERLAKVLGFGKLTQKEEGISDITIVIGRDSEVQSVF